MDIVDTFNHLIPSDQLDDSLLVGQNLECEASNEFGSGRNRPEDSLKNMLSDKDPMFGSASTQFHLLDNDDANFQVAGSTVAGHDMSAPESDQNATGGELTPSNFQRGRRKAVGRKPASTLGKEPIRSAGRGSQARRFGPLRRFVGNRPLGRPGRRGAENHEQEPLPSGVMASTSQEKKGLSLGSRINIHDVGPSMNPVVVLRRLTVTVGGYKIELLPGPSYSSGAAVPSVDFQDGSTCADSMGFDIGQKQTTNVDSAPEATGVGAVQRCAADDTPLGLGPYVNPNEVQNANGALLSKSSVEGSISMDTKVIDQNDSQKQSIHKPQSKNGMEQRIAAKKLFKSKQALSLAKNKHPRSSRPGPIGKGPKHPHLKKVPKGTLENLQATKGKPVDITLKRPGVHLKAQPGSKMQKVHDGHPVKQHAKLPDSAHPPISKTVAPDISPAMKLGMNKHPHPQKRPQNPQQAVGKPSIPLKDLSEEEEQEKPKMKKADKILQRQRSRNARSISVDEPQLFIPDNAPVVKKETVEDEPADGEAVWDPSKHCGLCKKPHNNRFMVGCSRCDDWFHGDCVGLDLSKVQQMEKEDQEYVCLKCCAEDDGKTEPEAPSQAADQAAPDSQENKPALKPKPGQPQSVTAGGVRPFRKDSAERPSTEVRDSAPKTGTPVQLEKKRAKISPATSKKPSTDQIRRSVRDSLKDILLKRLKESDFKISSESAAEVAKKTEKQLFAFFQGTDSKYKSKYRSLMFNLKDTKNNVLFKRVLKGEISPEDLIRMSPEELASKELAAWRKRENRHTIEMIEKQEREVERRPITKITHKGEIEIENQEPEKAPEAIEVQPEPVPRVSEGPEEKPQDAQAESPKSAKDTTGLHKSHLFDLNCKICTGRMAPPVEEAPTKVVKVATTVLRRQSTMDGETHHTPTPSLADELALSVIEESLFSAYEGRSESLGSKEETATFLASLESLWNGYVDMPAVARFLTKAYPVSGTLEHLTEDLPDSIQVGGRISPQIVWDYVEKIRASGTKEVCVIRFTPETEEDEISYTLLYAYFSSRRRYGVVANNRKQVKDMYLIPLGSTEKIPHQIVPFDGPGLEASRPNLLLGLLIRQRPKRDFEVILPMDAGTTARFLPESKTPVDSISQAVSVKDEGNDYVNSVNVTHKKEALKVQQSPVEEAVSKMEPSEKVPSATEDDLQPLRFLPGVLVGLGGPSPSTPDLAGKPASVGDDPKNVPNTTVHQASVVGGATQGSAPTKAAPSAIRLDRFVIKKKDPKTVKNEPVPSSPGEKSMTDTSPAQDKVNVASSGVAVSPVSLRDKPPDVSTETFLTSLSIAQPRNESTTIVSPSNTEATSKQDQPNATSLTVSNVSVVEGASVTLKIQSLSSPPIILKPPISGILKNSSAPPKLVDSRYPQAEDKGTKKVHSPVYNVPVLNTDKPHHRVTLHGHSHQPQQQYRPVEDIQRITTISSNGKNEDHKQLRPGLQSPPFSPAGHGPPLATFAPLHTGALDYQYHPAPVLPFPIQTNIPFLPMHPQAPPNFGYPPVPPPLMFPQPEIHAPSWPQPVPPQVCFPPAPGVLPGPPLSYEMPRFVETSKPTTPSTKEEKGPDQRYSDPWERQPQRSEDRYKKEDRDPHGRHHHEKKSRHHDRDHDRKRWEKGHRSPSGERRHSHEDEHRDGKNRHSKGDRHAERRKDRHHSDDHSSHHKDRDKHRRDSDYEKGRRSSRDRRS